MRQTYLGTDYRYELELGLEHHSATSVESQNLSTFDCIGQIQTESCGEEKEH